jgi:diaminohydroxyphosphoribosylaminopyrimidine deaminase / 5-amino-6-(5-phosphoribosylamino)uracil reductase
MNKHEKYMHRCIDLAQNGLGTTYPNPLVGSVIVCNDKIIGEGWHRKAGEPHAEVNAINSVKDPTLLDRSTIYVSLEPCSHFGKTPPCCDLIIEKKIPNIVIGTVDPFAKVSGNGIQRLKDAGRNVMVGVLEKKCQELNKRFFTFHIQKRPYIILKWAESRDGFIAPKTKSSIEPFWISNVYSRQLVHKWRTKEQAILVGTQTVLDDNPSLDARHWRGQNPMRIVLDQNGKINLNASIYDGKLKTIIFTEEKKAAIDQCIFENVIFDNRLVFRVIERLHHLNIQSVIVEGGRQTIQSFIDADLWDEARFFKTKLTLNEGTKAPKIKGNLLSKETILDDELLIVQRL